jgi:hypothetical protein
MKRLVCVFCFSTMQAWGDGHGPAFGYSTAILGAGDSSVETELMWRSGTAMIAPRFSFGINENVQFSISAPLHLNHGEHPVGRFTGMMPGDPEIEALVAWRFHHSLTGIGTRNESTLFVGLSGSTQVPPRADGPPLKRAPALYIGAATGHVSRGRYIWAGASYEHHAIAGDTTPDHQSDSVMGSLTFGWRPAFLRSEDPKSDLRFFLETTGEHIGRAWFDESTPVTTDPSHNHGAPPPPATVSSDGTIVYPNSGERGVFSGPSLLWTHRSFAVQTGVLFALWERRNGTQPAERFRAMVGFSYFFLKGRK